MYLSTSAKSIIVIFTIIFLSSLVILTKSLTPEDPTLVFVDDDFNEETPDWNITHFDNIQSGVNAVAENGTIYVYNGTYADEIIVNKSVTITGEHANNVLVFEQFYVISNDVVIENLTIANVSEGDLPSGIYDKSSNSTYQNLRLLNNTIGIKLSYLSNNTMITDNVFEKNTKGIYAYDTSHHILIKNNTIKNNTWGILIEYSQFHTIFHNKIINNSEVGFSIISSGNNLIYDNYFDNTFNLDLNSSFNNSLNTSKTSSTNIIGGSHLGGNYWNNYSGIDTDGDGIGETIHIVGDVVMLIDYLPLTNLINYPPILGTPEPANLSTNNPLEFDWSIQINDSESGIFDWFISCSNGQTSNSSESSNGTKILHLSNLAYSTTYTISVNVTDYYSWTNNSFIFTTRSKPSDNHKEEKTNLPPVANITAPDTGYPGEILLFDGNQSYDPDGNITIYTWNLGDETILQGKIVNHSYSTPGQYNITLTVTDNKGATDTKSKDLVIIKPNIPPQLSINLERTAGELTIYLTVSASDEDGDVVACNVSWGDGSSPTSLELQNGSETILYTYASYGNYTILVTGNDGSTETSATRSINFAQYISEEEKDIFEGFFRFITYNATFLDNKIYNRSILGITLEPQFVIPFATILSIILLFLFNFLVEFLSDYSSEKAIEYRKDRKDKKAKAKLKKAKIQPHRFLSKGELIAVTVTTLILSFVLTLTWAPDLTYFIEAFIIISIIVIVILFLRESFRSYLAHKQKLPSEFYIWPIGAAMMVVSTFIGNTFSLAANHHYEDEGDIKKCGKVTFIVSIYMYLAVLGIFIINLYYPSTILQMIVIVLILNLFIDLFPLNPMDGYEVRHWNSYLWMFLYIIVILTYITVYFNLYP